MAPALLELLDFCVGLLLFLPLCTATWRLLQGSLNFDPGKWPMVKRALSFLSTSIILTCSSVFRMLALFNYCAVILECVSLCVLHDPQYSLAFYLSLSCTIGLACQLKWSVVSPRPAMELMEIWLIATLQCTLLMTSRSDFGLALMWFNYGIAKFGLCAWSFHLLTNVECAREFFHLIFNPSQSFSDIENQSLRRKGVAAVVICVVLWRGWEVCNLHPWTNTFKNDGRYLSIQARSSFESAKAAHRAEMYYLSQLPHIEASINNFTLHPYFTKTEVWAGIRLEDIIIQRAKSFTLQFDTTGATGYKIEKDKCYMLNFLAAHRIEIPEIIGIYKDREVFFKRLVELKASMNTTKYPIFAKACHLTQGGDKGTTIVNSASRLTMELFPWAEQKWDQVARDDNRPWSENMNRLLANLEPGIALQRKFDGFRLSPNHTPLEVKVEVVWGRAYLGLFADFHDIVALRDGTFEFTDRTRYSPDHYTVGNHPDTRLLWLQDEGHMRSVWALAESVARAIGVGELRVDIFIDPVRPAHPAVNEISLCSGHNYFFHSTYLAEAWAGPLLAGKYNQEKARSGLNSGWIGESTIKNLKNTAGRIWKAPRVRNTTKEVWEI
ncbi:hypothetical protein AAMO2058_001622500 [Amorphochlora amoebiformis]